MIWFPICIFCTKSLLFAFFFAPNHCFVCSLLLHGHHAPLVPQATISMSCYLSVGYISNARLAQSTLLVLRMGQNVPVNHTSKLCGIGQGTCINTCLTILHEIKVYSRYSKLQGVCQIIVAWANTARAICYSTAINVLQHSKVLRIITFNHSYTRR